MSAIQVLAFDVFGTVVDWYGSIVREVQALGLDLDADRFALAWRAGYVPAMARVRSGELPWTRLDDLHRMILNDLMDEFGLSALSEDQRCQLNLVWHRLQAWPDVVAGLQRLKKRYLVCTLSNGNMRLLTDLSKNAQLPWDCILSAEVFRHYKPDPATYLGVADLFLVPPGAVMLVAAHQNDLDAAAACGLATALIERPMEFGPQAEQRQARLARNTMHASDLLDLAGQLGC